MSKRKRKDKRNIEKKGRKLKIDKEGYSILNKGLVKARQTDAGGGRQAVPATTHNKKKNVDVSPLPTNRGVVVSKLDTKLLGIGVDTLAIGFGINTYRDSIDFKALAEAKADARGSMFEARSVGVEFMGKEFAVSARGSKGYEYILNNGDVNINIAKEARGGTIYPEVFVTFRSDYLWRGGDLVAFGEVSSWLDSWAVIAYDKVSRVDLAVDLNMPFPVVDTKKEIVSLFRGRRAYGEGERDLTYYWGSGELVARFYDKGYEVVKKAETWMYPVWRSYGWDGISAVSRLEFQVRRDKVKEFGVNSYRDLVVVLPDMWRFFTTKQLRLCDRGSETNSSRWKSKGYWLDYEACGARFGECSGVMPVRVYRGEVDRLLQQGSGCFISALAQLIAVYGMDKGCELFRGKVALADEVIGSDETMAQVAKRVARYKRFNVA